VNGGRTGARLYFGVAKPRFRKISKISIFNAILKGNFENFHVAAALLKGCGP